MHGLSSLLRLLRQLDTCLFCTNLLGYHHQVHSLVVLAVLHEELGAAVQQDGVRPLVQILGNQLEGTKLLGPEGQLQGLGEMTTLEAETRLQSLHKPFCA